MDDILGMLFTEDKGMDDIVGMLSTEDKGMNDILGLLSLYLIYSYNHSTKSQANPNYILSCI